MERTPRRVLRVLSNNAVLTRDSGGEIVLVGRGIGFGRQVGDLIDESAIQQSYVELDPERVQMINWISSLGPTAADAISRSIDLATDELGELHPAAYVLLMDHIAFAVQRAESGETIENPLLPQIREMFPEEFATAQLLVRDLNEAFAVQLPDAEAAYIALHLNAARAGEPVKQPLQRANRLAGIVNDVARMLSVGDESTLEVMTHDLVALHRRLNTTQPRENDVAAVIRRMLGPDYEIAAHILTRLLGEKSVPRAFEGEAAYLAVQVHGWRMERQSPSGKETR
ncbi:transcriptional antiterminator, BglG family [Bowdeniella nasicola]|uniref:Transcriptional antiterminator, BglG family n=1 Tax=Bowdeniella nasicola TaxID=208480 RepID=A0A1H3X1B9_9ACTO|nr:PRD domain-containing protein [Bowdeniella nasicola]SDZ93209.1 transcriptional antiterminator, BglG family [Bowdeniella nasicola]